MIDESGIIAWSNDEVCQRLAKEKWATQAFLNTVERHDIDGAALLELTKEDLMDEFGVEKLGEVKTILRNIRNLHMRHGGTIQTYQPSLQAAKEGYEEEEGMGDSRSPFNISYIERRGQVHKPVKRFQSRTSRELKSTPFNNSTTLSSKAADSIVLDSPSAVGASMVSDSPLPYLEHSGYGRDEVFADSQKSSSLPRIQFLSMRRVLGSPSSRPSTPSQSGTADSVKVRGSSLDIEAAKKKGRHRHGREQRERKEMEESGIIGTHSALSFHCGLLEQERRFTAWKALFQSWVGDDGHITGSPEVDMKEAQDVLNAFYNSNDDVDTGHAPPSASFDNKSADLSTFLQYMESATGHLSPTLFDDLLKFFNVALGDLAAKKEASRRFALLQDAFRIWDINNGGFVSVSELTVVLTHFNQLAMAEGEDWLIFDLARLAFAAQAAKIPPPEIVLPTATSSCTSRLMESLPDFGELARSNSSSIIQLNASMTEQDAGFDAEGFIKVMTAAMARLGMEDFDIVYYRFVQLLDSLGDAVETEAKVKFPMSQLENLLKRSHPSQMFLLYGLRTDASKLIEKLPGRGRAELKGVVVASAQSEETAIHMIQHAGIGRGNWIYCMVSLNYTNVDGFLRNAAVLLTTRNGWMMHRSFRLFVYLSIPTLALLPDLVKARCIPINLAGTA